MLEEQKGELTKKIENNLRFLITISVFFLAIFSDVKLQGCIIIVCYIIDYIVFEAREKSFTQRNLKWINFSSLIGIGSYTIPLFTIGLSTQRIFMSNWEFSIINMSAAISTFAIVLMPVAILLETCFLSGKTWSDIKWRSKGKNTSLD